jgi:hypothetical protein
MITTLAILPDVAARRLLLTFRHTGTQGVNLNWFVTQTAPMFLAQVSFGDRRLVNRRDHIAEAWDRLEAKRGMR